MKLSWCWLYKFTGSLFLVDFFPKKIHRYELKCCLPVGGWGLNPSMECVHVHPPTPKMNECRPCKGMLKMESRHLNQPSIFRGKLLVFRGICFFLGGWLYLEIWPFLQELLATSLVKPVQEKEHRKGEKGGGWSIVFVTHQMATPLVRARNWQLEFYDPLHLYVSIIRIQKKAGRVTLAFLLNNCSK